MCLMLACAGTACLAAGQAEASVYKMVLCAADNGPNGYATTTNTSTAKNPHGIFDYNNHCWSSSDPAGDAGYLRISEREAAGDAGQGAYGQMIFDVPTPAVHIMAAGGYTRQPHSFNDGWRARFWASGPGGAVQILTQGQGLPNSGIQWASSNIFGPHLWPFGHFLNFDRFVYELQCVRPSGCDRSGFNATDANSFVFILSDNQDSQVAFVNPSTPILSGQWVRGALQVGWNASDQGSGLRLERLSVDGAERHRVEHPCNVHRSQLNGDFARDYSPCRTGGPHPSSMWLDTRTISDGAHSLSICTQDYGQYQGLWGSGGQSCDQRTIQVDNSAPGAPSGLRVISANPQRYLDRFGAQFSLPPNSGSPIAKVHYNVVNAKGEVVKPVQSVSGIDPTEIVSLTAPAQAGDYRLRVWLEDEVGFVGPASTAPIPRDTTPPAPPQGLSVTPPSTSRSSEGFDLRWQNIQDTGSPIDAAHYQVLNRAGAVVVPTTTLKAVSIDAVKDLETPTERGSYTLRLWLSDAEGNVGAPVSAPLAYECVRSEAGGGLRLSAGFNQGAAASAIVPQKEGATLSGHLAGTGGGIADAPLCVFSRVITDEERQFAGITMTGPDGAYRIDIGAGPSRELEVVYRPGQRELSASAILRTRVKPTFQLVRKVVRNKGFAIFRGQIPGPRNSRVVVILQVKSGKAWRVFRRYRTRAGGLYVLRYRFTQTSTPTVYRMRAQVREQSGYPYEEGNSQVRRLRVVPARP